VARTGEGKTQQRSNPEDEWNWVL